MIDKSTLRFSGHHHTDTLLHVVDCGAPPTHALRPWQSHRTDLRYIMAVWECDNGGISEVPCIVYPDGRCDERFGHFIAWRIDKKATYLQPSTYPGQLKPMPVYALSDTTVDTMPIQRDMFMEVQ